jgi:hypothetical protein
MFAVSADTTMMSSDVETIDVEDDEGDEEDVQSPKAATAPSPAGLAAETPRPAPGAQGRSTSSTGPTDDVGSNKRLKKAPPKPCMSGLGRRPSKSAISSTTYLCFPFPVGCLSRSPIHEQGSSDDVGGAKNASGQEAFGSKAPETLVVESSAASAADVTSMATRAGTTAAPEADKAGTSARPQYRGWGRRPWHL